MLQSHAAYSRQETTTTEKYFLCSRKAQGRLRAGNDKQDKTYKEILLLIKVTLKSPRLVKFFFSVYTPTSLKMYLYNAL